MPLILAVEPDRRQASHIAAVLRGRPRTELVIAESAAAALKAIAARVPDLVLTSPLLSRQDEADLAEWLRALGPAAAHVQSLTIPILAPSAPETTRGMLSMLRRRRPRKSSAAGCEPGMFASQVGLYLERASFERLDEPAAIMPPQPPAEPALEWPAAAIEPEPEPAVAEIDIAASNQIEPVIPLPALEWPAAIEPDPEPAVAEIDIAASNQIEAVIALPALKWPAAAIERDPEPGVAEIDIAACNQIDAVIALPAPGWQTAAIEPEPEASIAEIDIAESKRIEAAIALAALRANEESRWVAVPLDEVCVPEPAPVEPVVGNTWVPTPVPAVDELVAVDELAAVDQLAAAPADQPDTAPMVLLPTVYALRPEPAVEAVVAAPAVEVEAPAFEVEAVAFEAVAAPAAGTARRRKAQKPKTKPVQDEWGLFDPSQCGFAALLDKLDEITAQETSGRKRDDVDVRVISY